MSNASDSGADSVDLGGMLASTVADSGVLDAAVRAIACQVAEVGRWLVDQLPEDMEIPSNSAPPTVGFQDGRGRSGVLVLRQGTPVHWVLAVNDAKKTLGKDRR